jgi:hypothetical protein
VNIVSGSFGSLIVRWMIENDLAALASSGAIARWLSVEGLLAGNWAASRDRLADLVDLVTSVPDRRGPHALRLGDGEPPFAAERGGQPVYAEILMG